MNVYDLVEFKGNKKPKPTSAQDCIMCMACVNGCPFGACTVPVTVIIRVPPLP